MRIVFGVAAVYLSLLGLAYAGDPAAVGKRHTDIPAQSLAPALRSLAQERGFQIVFASREVSDLRTRGAAGELTTTEALTRLLTGTGLTYKYLDEKTVTIEPAVSSAVKTNIDPDSEGRLAGSLQGCSGLSSGKTGSESTAIGWTALEGCKEGNSMENLALARAEEGEPVQANDGESGLNGDLTSKNKIEEIVVTAQKRVERLQDVPISISVLSGGDLDKATDSSVNDAISQVAGVYSFVNGNQGDTKFSVRGVTSNTSNFSGGSTVGYYLDELPFGFVRFPTSPDANAYDLERVEVLRGPQGTLYGANSLNGVIRVITQDADLSNFEMKARSSISTTEGGSENYGADVVVNVPIVKDKVALRAVGGYENQSGWIDQPLIGRPDVNDTETSTLRVKLNAALGENLTVEAMAWFSRKDRGGPSAGIDDQTRNTLVPEPINTDYDLFGFSIDYEFSAASLTAATSYIDYFSRGVLDLAGGAALTTILPAKVLSQEVRLSSKVSGPLRWSLGGIYRDAEDGSRAFFPVFFASPGISVFKSKSVAVFGEMTYAFADGKFDVTGGLRYFEDDTSDRELSRLGPAPATNLAYTEDTFDALTPRLVLTWHADDDLNVYGSVSQGFRSGFGAGSLLGTPLDPVKEDSLTNYEIGAKGSASDRLRYDVAAYYINWKDTKQQLFVPFGPSFVAVPLNSSNINGIGFDANLGMKITDRLDVSLAASWNDLAFESDVISRNVPLFRKDDRPDESPSTTFGARVDYVVPLKSALDLGFSVAANYHSKTSTHTSTGAKIDGDDVFNSDVKLFLQSSGGWSVSLFANNVTDENPIVRPFGSVNRNLDTRMRPRTIGVQADVSF